MTEQFTNIRVTNKAILPINTNIATINGRSLIELRESIDMIIPADGNYGDVIVSGNGTIWTVTGGGGGGGNGYFPQGW